MKESKKMKFAAIGPSTQARDFLSSSSFSRSSARVNEKNVCLRNFSIEEREPQNSKRREGGCQRRDDASSFLSKSNLSSLSLSLSSAKRMKTGRKATRGNRTREGVLGLTFLCVCVCSRTAFFSRSACDVFCITDVEESARVCKNYEERSASFSTKKKNEKRQKSTRWENEETRARARRKKKQSSLFSSFQNALRSLY